MTDYAARSQPDVFKPAIDAALLRIAQLAGATSDVAPVLAALPAQGSPWSYLAGARDAVRPFNLADAAGSWGRTFLAGPDRGNAQKAVRMKHYPPEARPALGQGNFVGGEDADILLVWTRTDGRLSVCHAHPEGFWVRGQDPIDFIERVAQQAEGTKPAPIFDPEVEELEDAGDDDDDHDDDDGDGEPEEDVEEA